MSNLICVPKSINNKLKKAIEDGEISTETLLDMTESERITLFEKKLGKEYASEVNKKFTDKFNTNISKENLDLILKDLTEINTLRAKDPNSKEWALKYIDLTEKVDEIINPERDLNIGSKLKERIDRVRDSKDILSQTGQGVKEIIDVATNPAFKALKASADVSFIARQGGKVFFTNPKVYKKNVANSLEIMAKALKDPTSAKEFSRQWKANYLMDPDYELFLKNGLKFGAIEEYFPPNIAKEIPAVGRIFEGSDLSFTMFSQGARFDLAKNFIENARKLVAEEGRELTQKEIKDFMLLSNEITSRGVLGKAEGISELLNRTFFSPRFVMAQIATFLRPLDPNLSPLVRAEARKSSLKTFAGIASIMGLVSLFTDVETDPRSSKFGRAKIGDSGKTTDLTFGLGQYVSLATRLALNRSKIDGKVKKPFGGRIETVKNWGLNKLAPLPALLRDVEKGEHFGGEKVTPQSSLKQLTVPITAETIYEVLQDDQSFDAFLGIMAEITGAGLYDR